MINLQYYDNNLLSPSIPQNLITQELSGLYGSNVLAEMSEIMKYYAIFEHGAEFAPPKTDEYIPADLRFRASASIMDKELRFLFSNTPDITINSESADKTEEEKQQISELQSFVDKVLKQNNFSRDLLRGARDCFIGKRVAIVANFNANGINVSFIPSLEFIYDVDENNADIITKLVVFYNANDEKQMAEQRIYRKRYWLGDDGFCYVDEALFDGTGSKIQDIMPETRLLFSYIPAVVIVNDGLTGDLSGRSEIELLAGYESWYSKMANADVDSLRMGMNPIRYTVDADQASTENLPINPGAFWDVASNQMGAEAKTAQVGVLPSDTGYSGALDTTLERLMQNMYNQVAVPNVSPSAMQGVVTSGKTLRAIYWDLIVRCDEKMLSWRPAIEFIVRCIIDGAKLYPESMRVYTDTLPDISYTVDVENNYSLPDDIAEEKQLDLAEVEAQTMSRRTYMKRWYKMTDDEVDNELAQIAKEREILENSYGFVQEQTEQPIQDIE